MNSIIKKNVFSAFMSRQAFLVLVAIPVISVFGFLSGQLGSAIALILPVLLVFILLVLARQHELLAALILFLHLYVDWYLGFSVVAQSITVTLLVIFFVLRSPRSPWAKPRVLWLWILLLLLAISPTIRGTTSIHEALYYFPDVLGGSLLMIWLGTLLARDVASVARAFTYIAAVGTVLALIGIIQYKTGILLFKSARFDASINAADNYVLLQGSTIFRIGLFFVNPDWSGAFFALMLFIPFGLFVYTSSIPLKILYLIQIILLLPALLFTYSNGAWIGVFVGLLVFTALVGRNFYRVLILSVGGIVVVLALTLFSSQILLQIQHASGQQELSLRLGAWETGIKVIQAFPWSGIGLGLTRYLQGAEPYRVPAQYISLAHPHNSYIELGAMGGIPLLIVFVALLSSALWQAWRIHFFCDRPERALFAGGIAAIVTISVNSFSINEWTLPPLAVFGWLILGILSSPLLEKSLTTTIVSEPIQEVMLENELISPVIELVHK